MKIIIRERIIRKKFRKNARVEPKPYVHTKITIIQFFNFLTYDLRSTILGRKQIRAVFEPFDLCNILIEPIANITVIRRCKVPLHLPECFELYHTIADY